MRPTTTTTSGRDRRFGQSYGVEQNGSQVTREVNASLNVKASDGRAEGLARVLGVVNSVAQPVLMQRIEESGRKAAEEGFLDVQTGKVNEARTSKDRAYLIGVSKAKARADVAAAELEWNQKVQDEGLNNLSPEEFTATFQAWQAERFDKYADDAVGREYALPGIAALSEKAGSQYQKNLLDEQALTYEQNSGSALSAFADDTNALIASLPPGSPEAAAARAGLAARVEEEYQQHYNVLGGTRANTLIAQQLIQAAVASGDESIIDLIPKRAASVPAIGRAMQHGKAEARSVRDANDKALDETRSTANKAQREGLHRQVILDAARGKDSEASILTALEAGTLTPDEAEAMLRTNRVLMNDNAPTASGKGEVNEEVASALEIGIYDGDVSQENIIALYEAGDLGSGPAGKRELTRLLALSERLNKRNDNSIEDGTYRKYVTDASAPSKDRDGNIVASEVPYQVHAKRRYEQLIDEGKSPQEASEIAVGEAKRMKDAAANNQRANPSSYVPAEHGQRGRGKYRTGNVYTIDGLPYRFLGGNPSDQNSWEELQ